MSSCGPVWGPDAASLVEGKWSYAERLASSSVNDAKSALETIAGGVTSIVAAGWNSDPITDSGGGGADVDYVSPEVPSLPDLSYSVGNNPGASLGGGGAGSVRYKDPGQAPSFSGTSPGSGQAIVYTPPTPLGDFSDTYSGPPTVVFRMPSEIGEFNDAYSAPSPPILKTIAPPKPAYGEVPAPTSKSAPSLTAHAPDDPGPVNLPQYPQPLTPTYPNAPDKIHVPLPTLRTPDLSGITAILDALKSGKPAEPSLPIPSGSALDTFNTLRNDLGADLSPILPIESVLTWMLSGRSIGVSDAVAQSLRDRAFAAEDQQAHQAESAAMADWLSRGFTLPGGALDMKLSAVQQQARDKKAQLNRDLWLEEAKMEIEALKNAVQMGIQYQGQLWDAKTKLWSVCGDLAVRFVDVQVKVLDAIVTVYKTKMEAWQAEATVAREYIAAKLQAEMSKLEITKVEAQVSGLFVQLNQQNVELYKAGMDGVMAEVSVYKTQIEAANAQLQAETLKIEVFAKKVAAYSASVQAYEAEWRGYSAAVQADTALVEGFRATVQAYTAEVDAYGKEVEADRSRINAEIAINQADIEAFKTKAQVYSIKADAFGKKVQAEQSRVSGEVEAAKLPLAAYTARAQVYSARSDAYGKQVQAAQADVMAQAEAAKLPVEIYRAEVQAYASRVDGFSKQVIAAQADATAQVDMEKLRLASFSAAMEAYKLELQRAGMELESKARVHGSQVQLFGTLVENEKARVSAGLQNIDQKLRQTQFDTSIELKKAELDQTKTIEVSKIALSAHQSVATVSAQLAGAALSAVNASASISNGFSSGDSRSCSTSYNYAL